MIRHLLTSSILMAGIFMIRFFFGGRIRQRVKYALWIAVLVKLLLPFLSFEVPYDLMQGVADFTKLYPAEKVSEFLAARQTSSDSRQPASEIRHAAGREPEAPGTQTELMQKQETAETAEHSPQNTKNRLDGKADVSAALYGIWALGACAAGLMIAVSNFSFYRKLKRRRIRRRQEICPLDVYDSPDVSVPCLFGMRRPCIYLPLQEDVSEESMGLMTAHEFMHYRHKDHIWALLRSICAVLYWFHPLVWAAASASARDAELACDEAVCSRMDAQQIKAYGRTLLEAASYVKEGPMLLSCASHALRRKSEIEERICMMIKRPKAAPAAGIVFCAAAAVLAVGTFGRVQGQEHAPAQRVSVQQQAGASAERTGTGKTVPVNAEGVSVNKSAGDQKENWICQLEADAGSWIMEVTGCRRQKSGAGKKEKGYLLTGVRMAEQPLALTDEEKQRLDRGETMTIILKSADVQAGYALARGEKPEYASSDPDEAQQYYYILQAEDGSRENLFFISNESDSRPWTAVDADSGMEKRLVINPDEALWVKQNTPVQVTNYYAYNMQGAYPENENDRRWTMQKYYQKYLKELAKNNPQEKIAEIIVHADGSPLHLEECYLP